MYGSVDEEDEEQTESDSDIPAAENDTTTMDEDDAVPEGSNEAPIEE